MNTVFDAVEDVQPNIPPSRTADGWHPLSAIQRSLWFLYRMQPEQRGYYNIAFVARARPSIAPLVLQRALDCLIARHEMLRVRFAEEGGEPIQRAEPKVSIPLEVIDVVSLDDAAVVAQVEADRVCPFDPLAAPLMRVKLYRAGPQECVIGFALDHLICDGWSLWQILEELGELLRAEVAGQISSARQEHLSFFEHVIHQRQWIEGARGTKQLEYWRSVLGQPFAALNLLPDRKIGKEGRETVSLLLSTELTEGVRALSAKHGVPLFATLLASYFILLHRLSGQDRIAVGSPMPARGKEWGGTVGNFTNPVVLCAEIEADMSIADFLKRVGSTSWSALKNQNYPLAELVERLNPQRAQFGQPYFQVLFTFQKARSASDMMGLMAHREEVGAVHWGGSELGAYGHIQNNGGVGLDLAFALAEVADHIDTALDYDTRKFERSTIERYLGYWQRLLRGMVEDEAQVVASLPILPEAERALVLKQWNDTARAYPQDKCLHELFEAQVERDPEAVAVVQDETRLSYGELNGRANRLARHLRALGVKPDSRVAVCLERSPELVVALLAVLKAGGAYVPLDPGYPGERLSHMLEDSAPVVILTHGGVGAEVQAQILIASSRHDRVVPVVDMDRDGANWHKRSAGNLARQGLAAHHLAYVIYTSGSTGLPKGAMNEHRGIVNRLCWMQEEYGLNGGDAVLQKTPFSFDVSVWEFFWPLFVGARLVMVRPDGHKDPVYLGQLIQSATISTLHFVPSMLQVFLELEEVTACARVIKRVMCSGEALPAHLVKRFHERLPGVELHNLYGPTEAAVDVTAWPCQPGEVGASIPIGRPIANTRIYILDTHLQAVPIGVAGELYIGGVQVGRGYLNRPELTAERFVADPYSEEAEARMYKTGDLGRWLPDGTIEYLGRNDFQVKIRGFRIELGEIEAKLAQSEGVREVVVLAREDEPGEKRLVAYYVGEAEAEALRADAVSGLPQYMVPAAYVKLAQLPLTPNGKLDRKALPAPEGDAYVSRGYEAPEGEVEATLARIWGELLKVERVGRQDNFFELGGHSLLAVSLIERMRKEGLHADVRALFTTPTLAELAQSVGEVSREVQVPPNLIPAEAKRITPEMLPLVELSQEAIDSILEKVAGGAANVQDIYPLAPLQEGILFHHLMAQEGDPYLLSNLVGFGSRARLDSFLGAIQQVIDRHDILRTGLAWAGLAKPVQVVRRHAELSVEEVVLDPRDGAIAAQLEAKFDPSQTRIDVSQAPLLKCHVAEDAANGRWLLRTLSHHLVLDHTTLELVVEEAQAIEAGRQSELPVPVPFRNFVAQARLGIGEEEHEGFFRRMLGDIDEPTAPFGLTDVQGDGRGINEAKRRLEPELAKAVRTHARQLGVSAASLMHLAWALVLARTTGRREVVFGTVLFGRMQGGEQADRVLGMFINTLPVRIGVGEAGVAESLKQTHALLAQLLRHEHAPLSLAQRCSGVDAPAPLFSAVLNYRHSREARGAGAESDEGIEVLSESERTNYPLGLSIDDLGEGFELTAQVMRPIEAERLCEFMHRAVVELVGALEKSPQTPVARLDVLPEAERALVLKQWNDTARAYPQDKCLHELFEAQVERDPEAVAVVQDETRLSYGELNGRANRLARHLRALGVKPDSRVAVCLERSPELVVALLAVLKAGGAYVPLDPGYPGERLSHMLEDSAPVVILGHSATREVMAQRLAGGVALIDVEMDASAWANQREDNPSAADAGLNARHLAYVIYTSGSTGLPKGVMNEHRGLSNLVSAQVALFHVDATSRVLQFASSSFDASVSEIGMALGTGACLCLARREEMMPGRPLLTTLQQMRVTHVTLPPSALPFCEMEDLAFAATTLIVAGEAIAPKEANRWSARLELINAYGPTETTVCATTHACTVAPGASLVPIGRPIANTRIYILDARMQPVPIGVTGELYIGGAGVARGYLNRPELTAERFVADPYSEEAEARMYKTGDLGRWLPDGTIEYLGRNDFQVKIRGFRIELGEIEAKLAQSEGVREVVVLAREDEPGEKRLVAYYVGEAEAEALRADAVSGLPQYMVPAAYVKLAQLPLTPNGKLDRKALPAPEGDAYVSRGYEAPEGEVEATLARIWGELLKVERVGRQDNFFELGGHSLLAVSLIERMRKEGLHADVRALFTTPTLAELAQSVGEVSREVQVPPNLIPAEAKRITPEMLPLVELSQEAIDSILEKVAGGAANVQDIYPLAPLQEGILFHHLMAQEGDPYLLPSLVGFGSRARLDSFLGAIQQVIDRHDILRTGLAWAGLAKPVQVVRRHAELSVEEVVLDPRDGAIAAQLEAKFDPSQTRIDVSQAPLLKCHVAEDVENGRWLLHILAHHLALDHTTLELVVEEAQAIEAGRQSELPVPVPFRNFVAQARLGIGEEEHEGFFRRMLGDIDEPTAPFGLTDVQGDGRGINEAKRRLEPELAKAVRTHARQLGVSAASLMHLAWALVLARTTGRREVVFGTVLFGRMQGGEQADRVLGMFINTLPVRIGVGEAGVAESLKQTHALLAQLLRHEHAPLSLAQRCSGVDAPAPLFSALLNYRHSREASGAGAESDEGIEVLGGNERTNYPLCLNIDDQGEGFELTAQVMRPIEAERLCEFMHRAVVELVGALEKSPQTPVARLDVLPEAERALVLKQWNDTARAYPQDKCLHELFEAQVERDPEAVAVVQDETRLSYGELNGRANRLARHLRALGVKPDSRVAVCLERSPELVVALLAVLKAGGAYVPLDPGYPGERLSHMLEDSAPVVILTHGGVGAEVQAQILIASSRHDRVVPVVDMDRDGANWHKRSAGNLARQGLAAHHLAYVIYTSGSTGLPKGAMNEHRGIVNRLCWMQEEYGLNGGDAVLQKTPFSFDVSVWEFFWPLFVGARLVMVRPDGHKDPVYLGQLIQSATISTLHFVPSMLQVFLELEEVTACARVIKRVMCSGEALPAHLVKRFHERLPGVELHNLYGPTEAAVDVTAWPCQPGEVGASIPIGRPIANTRIYILDTHLQAVPIGVAGELYIGGVQVGRGYLNRPELTAERFVADPYSEEAEARMYKTGDLGRWLPDGTIEYLGRNDFQVKIRGFRIELGEIEAKLAQSEGVREVVVLAREDEPGEKRLVAYYVGEAEAEALRADAVSGLPQYMVPAAYVKLAQLPLTPNGKLDRKALPAPEGDAYVSRGYEAPEGEVEATLARIWGELLKVERVGRQDNFFELGGHSLLAVSLIERMRKEGLHADVRALFTTPTLAELAQSVGEVSREVQVPPNLIPAEAKRITPEMLPLVELSQEAIDSILEKVAGGAANVQDIYPLAPLQEGILFHHLMAQEGDPYLLPSLVGFGSRARLDSFLGAIQQVIDRHDILRTGLAWAGLAKPVQVVRRHAELSVEEVVLDPRDGAIAAQLEAKFDPSQTRIDVSQAPLLKCHVAEDVENGRWLLHILAHHLALDHTTLELVVEEAQAIEAGRQSELPVPVPFRNFVAQARLGIGEEEHEGFFRRMLGDIDEPTAPFGLTDVQGDGRGINEAKRRLEPELAKAVRTHARQLGVSAASLMHLAWALVLARTTGRREVVFGTVLFGRMQGGEQADRVLGMFINTLPVRIGVGEAGVAESLKQTHALLAQLLRHEHAPLSLAQRCSGVDAPAPLFSALLNYRHSREASGAGAESDEGIEVLGGNERTNYPLCLDIDDQGEGFELTAQVMRPIEAERLCEFMHRAVVELVGALEKSPQTPVARLDVLPEAERALVLKQWNDTARAYPQDKCLHELFEAQVERDPEAVAVVQDETRLSYGELNGRANRLARHLRALGVKPDSRVAVCLERSPELVVALLAVLKAGGAYVPLDPGYPGERLSHMLEDSAPVVILTHGGVGAEVQAQILIASSRHDRVVPVVDMDRDGANWHKRSAGNLARQGLAAHHLAYVIYTSGSTGLPKGVMIEHRSVVNYTQDAIRWFGLSAQDVVLQQNSLNFDLSIEEMLPALVAGATVAPSKEMFGLGSGSGISPSVVHLTAAHWHTLVGEWAQVREQAQAQLRGVRLINVTGDALSAQKLEEWEAIRPAQTQLINTYGPTEITVSCSAAYVRHEPDVSRVSIGKPFANTYIYILDARMQPVPIGVTGELYIGGAGVARGYLNRPELTAERFVADPYSEEAEARMYKTGDLGRWLPDGTIEYLGRNDFQVKIRGFRIELGEIEAKLAQSEGVREVVVLAREDEPGEKRLVAYYVGEAEAEALRADAVSGLPQYMVPAAYVKLAQLPLTPNGKLDRKALPAPEGDAYVSRGYEAPEGEVEATLARIWGELLKVERVGRQDNFFELGGHSLLAVSLIERMRKEGLHADVRALFTTPTLAELAQSVGEVSREVQVPPNLIPAEAKRITPEMLPLVELSQEAIDSILEKVAGGAANVQDIYPLAPLQEGMLFHHLMDPDHDAYVEGGLLAFKSKARLDSLLAALQKVIDRHDILRTGLAWAGLAKPVQVVRRHAELSVEEVVLDPRDGAIAAQLEAKFDPSQTRIDVSQAPLLKCHVAEDAANGRWLLRTLSHHLVLDHTTLELVVEEAQAIEAGRQSELPVPVPFRNFVAQARLGIGEEEHEGFFRRMLGDIDEPTAPFGLTDVQGDGRGINEAKRRLEPELAKAVRTHARQLGVSAASLMHLAWALVLARTTGRREVVFGTVLFGRMQGGEQADRVLGMFINTLPVRIGVGEAGVAESLKQTHALLAQLLRHEHAPLSLAQRCSGVDAPAPLFSALLNYRHSREASGAGAESDEGIEVLGGNERTNYPLCLNIDDQGEGFELTAQVMRPIEAERLCEFMHRAVVELVGALEKSPQTPVARLDVLPEAERALVLKQWNDTARAYPQDKCLHELFEAQVERDPEAVAVVQDETRLSYGELNGRANRLARHLRALGVKPDSRVAVCLERSPELVVALLAVLKAGGAYVPLDPGYPGERLSHMLEDSAPVVILTHGGVGAEVQAQILIASSRHDRVVPVVDMDRDGANWHKRSAGNLARQGLAAHHLAYVIYTSGSTGLPKGAMNEHRGIVNRLCWMQEEYGLNGGEAVLQKTPFSFDVSVWEFFWPLFVGARLVMVRPDGHKDPVYLGQLIQSATISTLHFVPSMLQVFLELEEVTACARVIKRVMCSGEALPAHLVKRFHERLPGVELHNLYGPTEAAVDVTAWPCQPGEVGASIPIGRPIANTRIYILDTHLQAVPIGVAGELYIGGVQVGRGYLNRPELTAERFVADPYSEEAEARMYKTGDLGRWLPDGTIEYLGRNDFQVKIRGFRIELGEIEAKLAQSEGVREVVVLAREDEPGEKRLVAYYVGEAEAEALRADAVSGLPQYMVPAAYVKLAQLPLTPNGKLDRKALPAPEGDAYVSRGYEAPEGEVEATLARIWGELLKVERVGRQDNFFELGGHSLLAVQLVSRLRTELSVEIELAELFAAPVLQAFAERVAQARVSDLQAIESADREQPLPLSLAQQRLWFLSRLGEASEAYHIPGAVRLSGQLDRAALRQALSRIVARHEALRTRFVQIDGQAVQQIDGPEIGITLSEHDLRASADGEAELKVLSEQEAGAPFDLERGPLFRARLVQLQEQEHILLVTMHHIVSDGWSLGVLIGEFNQLYRAYSEGRPDPLPPLAIQYADYAAWQRNWLAAGQLERQSEFWRQNLAGAPTHLELPTDKARPAQQDYHGDTLPVELDAELSAQLKAFSQRQGVTLYMTLLASWAAVLGRLSGQEEVVIGSPVAGRNRAEVESLIGFFVNTLAVRINLGGEPSVAELLARTKAQVLAVQEHQDLPFEQIVEIVQPPRSLAHSPVYQVMLAWQNTPESELELPGLSLSSVEIEQNTAQCDLSLDLQEVAGAIMGGMNYATALFERSTIERYLGYWQRLLRGMVEDEAQVVASLPILPEAERALVLKQWNDTARAYPQDKCLHELFEAQVERDPEAVAVVQDETRLSYGELNGRANRLARHLRALGVKPDSRVAVCLERSPELVVALLAVLKAGGAYVPLDPGYPGERLSHMLEDSAPVVILTHGGVGAEVQAQILIASSRHDRVVPVVDMDRDGANWHKRSAGNLARQGLAAHHLAYVIYTSGSTGLPKGVMIEHRSVVNYTQDAIRWFGLSAQDVVLQQNSLNFDLSIEEMLPALVAGATVAPSKEMFGLGSGSGISPSVVHLTAAHWHTLVGEWAQVREQAQAQLRGVRLINVTGDALSAQKLEEWEAIRPAQTQLINTYGPTEITVSCSAAYVRHEPDVSRVSIGKPFANTYIYILDARMQPVPIGVTGELYIGGAGVARGYLNRPELTAERFVADPYSEEAEARMYKTGDLGRWLPDGTIEYLGRNDFQVKIRGFRIELGEIEAKLAQSEGVREVVVLAREDEPGEKRLVAYYVGEAEAEALRADAVSGLPQYMVPAAYVKLAQLPLTPNGKLDRKALPAPEGDAYVSRGYEAPEGEVEATLARIWGELLKVERVGRQDNFFELGGHSLLAVQLVSRLRTELSVEIELAELFAAPVLQAFAERVAQARVSDLQAIESADREQPLPLSLAQQRLWFLSRLGEASEAYHIPGAVRLSGQLDRAALRQALSRIVARHEALRTRFVQIDGQAVQQIDGPEIGITLSEHDLRASADGEAELKVLSEQEAGAPFDLERGPLFRARLVQLQEQEHILLVTMHHIVSDGWSLGVLIGEFNQLYRAYSEGRPDPLPPLAIQYADYAAWQRNWLAAGQLERQSEFWRQNLAGAPTHLELPTDKARPAQQDYHGDTLPVELDAELSAQLKAFSQRQGVTLYMTLLASWAAVLGRLSGQEEVVIGSPVAGRNRAEVESLIGFFVNTLAVRINLGGEPSVAELLARTKAQVLAVQEHQDLPFEQIVEIVQPPRSLAHSPVYQVMLAWQNTPESELELPGLSLSSVEIEQNTAQCDLSLDLQEVAGAIMGGMNYATALFERSTIERYLGYWQRLLRGMVEDEAQVVASLPILPEAERALVLKQWNDTARAYPQDKCLHELFEAQVERDPEAVAVVQDETRLSYGELNGRANRLARHLRALGVKPDSRVAVCLERSPELVVALLAVLKAGGAYVPLDPGYPGERLSHMLEDSAPVVILTHGGVGAEVQAQILIASSRHDRVVPVVDMDRDGANWHKRSAGNLARQGLAAHHLAYVIYTSGSTGLPKGVMIEHRSVVNYTQDAIRWFGLSAQDVVLQQNSLNFDLSIEEMLPALVAGATVAPSKEMFGLGSGSGISPSVVHLTAAHWHTLVGEWAQVREQAQAQLRGVRLINVTGDALSAQKLEEWEAIRPAQTQLINTYGPTEITVSCSAAYVRHEPDVSRVSIGKPFANTYIYILDARMQPVPIGVTGELYIGGAGVARGYLNRPELTAERFVADPYSEEAEARMYKTGDLGRWLPDGTIEYLGRNDFQVKIRGFRIELGEIEAKLAQSEGVREVVVLAREDEPGEKRLVAYYVGEAEAEALRADAVSGLPQYMVPAAYVKLAQLPLTPNGKLDRKALPAPEGDAYVSRGYEAPEGEVEATLARIWGELLKVERVGRQDNFFELGGHSLLAVSLIERMRKEGLHADVRALFTTPTLAEFATATKKIEEIVL